MKRKDNCDMHKGKRVCGHCYPAGSKRRALYLEARADIADALSGSDLIEDHEMDRSLDFMYELLKIVDNDQVDSLAKIAMIVEVIDRLTNEEE